MFVVRRKGFQWFYDVVFKSAFRVVFGRSGVIFVFASRRNQTVINERSAVAVNGYPIAVAVNFVVFTDLLAFPTLRYGVDADDVSFAFEHRSRNADRRYQCVKTGISVASAAFRQSFRIRFSGIHNRRSDGPVRARVVQKERIVGNPGVKCDIIFFVVCNDKFRRDVFLIGNGRRRGKFPAVRQFNRRRLRRNAPQTRRIINVNKLIGFGIARIFNLETITNVMIEDRHSEMLARY